VGDTERVQAGLLTYASGGLASLPGFPVAGFRRLQGLGAYSGGTVRDFHPIVYSPPKPNAPGGT